MRVPPAPHSGFARLRGCDGAATVAGLMLTGFTRSATALILAFGLASAGPAQPAQDTHTHGAVAKKKKATKPVDYRFGREGDPRKVKRVIKITMSDTMRYFPDEIRVKRGDTVRFHAQNGGQMPHEMVLGTMEELKKHAETMRKEPHAMAHDEPYIAYVQPGESGRIVWQFTRPGEFYYACLLPGHFEAGMIGTIVVR